MGYVISIKKEYKDLKKQETQDISIKKNKMKKTTHTVTRIPQNKQLTNKLHKLITGKCK